MIDVCLILEGTYPYVAGGVSTWVHQLIQSMRDLRFAIVNISPFADPRREFKYMVPPHVLDIQDVYLHDYQMSGPRSSPKKRRAQLDELQSIHQQLLNGRWEAFGDVIPILRDPNNKLTLRDMFDTKESWNHLLSVYEQHGEQVSFLDFFWTWRSVYLPLLSVATAPIPPARLYHTLSTGYAGLLASVAKQTTGKKMLLTEHGIYTHERTLEIAQASWIYSPQTGRFRIERELPFFKRLWLGLFKTLGGIAYHNADQILTLYEGNRTREILDGADPEKISIIPNGVDLAAFRKGPLKSLNTAAPTIAFIGRVVPIKDVKTFIQASKSVLNRVPQARFLIVGPMDEDPDYTRECLEMVENLDLKDHLTFTGKVDVMSIYQTVDLVVLTSLSEAQPYVILEANAMGVPVVTTDVGACREMVEGRTPEDRDVGPSGLLTQISDPEGTAQGILQLIQHPARWHAFSEAGRVRVNRTYDQNDLLSQYLNLYEKNLR